MVGVCGVIDGSGAPDDMVESMRFEDWYGVERRSGDDHGIVPVHHADRDPDGWSIIDTDRGTLLMYGYVTDRGGVETEAALCDAILDEPAATLADLDGSFAVAATDKLGMRTLYCAPGARGFASNLGALASVVDEPTIDVRAISEVLQGGFTWGRKTLLRHVDSLTYGEYVLFDENVTVESYWRFDTAIDRQNYVADVYDAFSDAVATSVDTVPDDRRLGVYLSGGLDSRLLAALATESRSDIVSLTYDANPGFGANPDLARELAEALRIDNEWLPYTLEETARHIREGAKRADGMQSWTALHALPGQLEELGDHADVMFWAGGQGELFGEDVPKTIYRGDVVSSYTEYWSDDVADRVLVDAPSLRETFEDEFAGIDRPTPYDRAAELMIRNYYPQAHARGNVTETVAGVRVAHGLGSVVDAATPVPKEYRWGPIPTYLNRFGHALAPLKLELVQHHGGDIARVPYERTGVPPARSIWRHDASKLSDLLDDFLGRSEDATMFDQWYRESEALRETVDDLLDDAMVCPFFHADALASLRERHQRGEGNHIDPIAKVTTVEAWLQAYLD